MGKALIVLSLLLAGCTTPGGNFCQVAKPLRLDPTVIAAFPPQDVKAALEHNRKGERLCGWRP